MGSLSERFRRFWDEAKGDEGDAVKHSGEAREERAEHDGEYGIEKVEQKAFEVDCFLVMGDNKIDSGLIGSDFQSLRSFSSYSNNCPKK